MDFRPTPLEGAYLVSSPRIGDPRGFFVRSWCRDEFRRNGLTAEWVQSSVCHNHRRGTIRGMHLQRAPHAESKLVRCVRGAVYDVLVDLRPESMTHRQWFAVQLSDAEDLMLYIPAGLAHGYQTLTDDATLHYEISEPYFAELQFGVRWNDPAFGIEWPLSVTLLSERDRNFPDYEHETNLVDGGERIPRTILSASPHGQR